MLISIITINYNNINGLIRTLKSVSNQICRDFEHIIVDGNSTDGSIEVIQSYDFEKCVRIIEPDTGIYNAMNKGIKAASGNYMLFLNSGDELFDTQSIEISLPKFKSNIDILYANVLLRGEGEDVLHEHPETLTFEFLQKRAFCHQSTFIKRELFSKLGLYREDIFITADWEFFIRAILLHGATFQKLDYVLAIYDVTGISSDTVNSKRIAAERSKILKENFPFFLQEHKTLKESQHLIASFEKYLSSNVFAVLENKFFRKFLRFQVKLYHRILVLKRKFF